MCCCRLPSSSGRSPANGSVTRSPPRRRRACGWAVTRRSATTRASAHSPSTLPRLRPCVASSPFIVSWAACAGSRRRPTAWGLRAVDMLDLQPDHLAGAQAAAIAEAEQGADLEVAGDGQQAPRLVRAHHLRYLLRLTDVIDLGGKIQSPQCHAEQKPQPGHDTVAIADAHAGLGQVQLEPTYILSRRGVGRPIEKCSKPLAAVNVAPLRARTKLPRLHVLDHAMTQRGDGVRTHRKL